MRDILRDVILFKLLLTDRSHRSIRNVKKKLVSSQFRRHFGSGIARAAVTLD